MVAVSRFVEFSVTEETFADGYSFDGTGKGDRAYNKGTGLSAGEDTFTIVKDSNDELAVSINGEAQTITLASGTDLDARFVARDIEYKLHSASATNDYDFAQVNFRNGGGGTNDFNYFIMYSGRMGNNSAANVIAINAASNDARTTLGWDVSSNAGGTDFTSVDAYTGTLTVSGVYGGQFDDFYTIQISDGVTVQDPTAAGGNTYGGTASADGIYVGANNTYTVTVATTNGASMDQGSGSVPQFTVTDSLSDQNPNAIELLHADHFYDVGDDGVRIKFTDAAFGDGDTFTVVAFAASGTATGLVMGTDANYIFSSEKGDSSKSMGLSGLATTVVPGPQLGSRGITLGFSNSGTTGAGEIFHVIARGPQPLNSDVTQLNFGNVTVSTSSAVKTVWFELISGANAMSTVKFSLQSDGTFSHHDQGDGDTTFRFGTAGAGSDAVSGVSSSNAQWQFSVDSDSKGNVLTTDIDSDTPTSKLFATNDDLAVVSSADSAETIGNFQGGVVSDFIWLAVRLGANETGANSTINYRMFFDFS